MRSNIFRDRLEQATPNDKSGTVMLVDSANYFNIFTTTNGIYHCDRSPVQPQKLPH